jgi:GT2 family glycosyltransferase
MRSPFGVGAVAYRFSIRPTYTDTISFGSYRRTAIEDVGGIDENLAVNEDYELNYRLREAGYRLYYSPNIQMTYYSRGSLSRLWRQYFSYGFWKSRVLQLHPRSVQIRHLIAPLFVSGLVLGFPFIFFNSYLSWAYMGVLGLYAALSVSVSFLLGLRHGWRYMPVLPVVFLCLHVSWGLGFWWGVWCWWVMRKGKDGSGA